MPASAKLQRRTSLSVEQRLRARTDDVDFRVELTHFFISRGPLCVELRENLTQFFETA